MATSVKLMLNPYRVNKDGTFPLVFQVIHSRCKKLIYVGFSLLPQEFDVRKECICRCADSTFSRTELANMNKKLVDDKQRISDLIKKLESENGRFTTEELVTSFRNRPLYFDLIRYIRKQAEEKEKLGNKGIASAYYSTANSLQKYINGKVNYSMKMIDKRFVMGYRDFLLKNRVTENTVNYYMRNFRTIYNLACTEGLSKPKEYPFKSVRTSACKTVKRALNISQVQSLIHIDLSKYPVLEKSRDLYLFSLYGQGMCFVDIAFLLKKDVADNVISYFRHKSKQHIRIPVSDELLTLMNRYSGEGDYVFSLIDVTSGVDPYKQYKRELKKININLKKIAAMVGITTNLTSYTARHTWATLAHGCGAPIAVISAGMGHTSEEMTRVYLTDLDISTLNEVNKMVLKLL